MALTVQIALCWLLSNGVAEVNSATNSAASSGTTQNDGGSNQGAENRRCSSGNKMTSSIVPPGSLRLNDSLFGSPNCRPDLLRMLASHVPSRELLFMRSSAYYGIDNQLRQKIHQMIKEVDENGTTCLRLSRLEHDHADPDKSILIIGGRYGNGTVEMTNATFYSRSSYPSDSSRSVHSKDHEELKEVNVRVTPVNKSHSLVLLFDGSNRTYYINISGELSAGPKTNVIGPLSSKMGLPISWVIPTGTTSLPSGNGHYRPIYCDVAPRSECRILSTDGTEFQHHSNFTVMDMLYYLVAVNPTTLIAAGDKGIYSYENNKNGKYKLVFARYSETGRYKGTWEVMVPVLRPFFPTQAVRLNDAEVLACGSFLDDRKKHCKVYTDQSNELFRWAPNMAAKFMKTQYEDVEMVLVGQTVYAFGSKSPETRLQTLDVSNRIQCNGTYNEDKEILDNMQCNVQWKLHPVKLRYHDVFGVAVMDNNLLDYTESKKFLETVARTDTTEAEYMQTLKNFDTNRDGYINATELSIMARTYIVDIIARLISESDTNRDEQDDAIISSP